MTKDREFIMVEGDRLPKPEPADAYIIAEVNVGHDTCETRHVRLICDSYYGIAQLGYALADIAVSQPVHPKIISLSASDDLTCKVEPLRTDKNCRHFLATKLSIQFSAIPEEFSLESTPDGNLELYAGICQAKHVSDELLTRWRGTFELREIWVSGTNKMMTHPPHGQNISIEVLEISATWPGVHTAAESYEFEIQRP